MATTWKTPVFTAGSERPPSCITDALERVRKDIPDAHLYVFSDDPVWAKENLTLDLPTCFISHNGPDRDYEDLRLMSNCQHHIIANSSFSWWGAWLCGNPGKIVVAPDPWFVDPEWNPRDIVPDGWVRMQAW